MALIALRPTTMNQLADAKSKAYVSHRQQLCPTESGFLVERVNHSVILIAGFQLQPVSTISEEVLVIP